MSDIKFKIREELFEVCPHPVPSKKLIPNWYKDMSQYIDKSIKCPMSNGNVNLTMKSCIPIRDTLTSGYTLLLPADLSIQLSDEGAKVQWADSSEGIVSGHSVEQVKGSPLENFTTGGSLMKINNPWRIYTKAGYSCYFTTPAYHDLPFDILPGIVDTDGIHEVNFPIIWKSKEEHVMLKKGLPMVQIYPFKRDSWSSSVEIEPAKTEHIRLKNFKSHIGRWYRDFVHKKKVYK